MKYLLIVHLIVTVHVSLINLVKVNKFFIGHPSIATRFAAATSTEIWMHLLNEKHACYSP